MSRRIEALRDELDAVRLADSERQQLILDVCDPDIARAEVLDRIRTFRPHLGIRTRNEQALLNIRRQLQELAALDRHDLLAARVTLISPFPDDLAAILRPPTLIDPDGDSGSHQLFQEQGKAQADRTAAGHRDMQDLFLRLGSGVHGRRNWERLKGRKGIDHIEPEDFISDLDLIAGLERRTVTGTPFTNVPLVLPLS